MDRSLQGVAEKPTDQMGRLQGMLAELQPDEIVEFDRLFQTHHRRASTHLMLAAAEVLAGHCSDDGFDDFRGWLISRGQSAYEGALADPDSIASVVPHDHQCQVEGFRYVALAAWATRTGKEVSDFPFPDTAPSSGLTGEGCQFEKMDEIFPRLLDLAAKRVVMDQFSMRPGQRVQ